MSPEWDRFVTTVKLNKGLKEKNHEQLYAYLKQHEKHAANECDAFDSDVDDEPTAQTIFMVNLSSARPANLQAGPSNASILSEVHDLENAIDPIDNHQVEHEIHDEVQQKNVIESTSADMGNSNVIPYEQYLMVNDVSVVPSSASSVPNDAFVLHDNDAYIPPNPLATELNIYKEQVAIYEQRAKYRYIKNHKKNVKNGQTRTRETEEHKRSQRFKAKAKKNRNKKEENLKKELHFVKLQLNSTIQNNKIIEETITALKQEFKQKESKFLSDFSNLKNLKDKLENKLYSQDQPIQTVHMMLKPTKLYDQDAVTAIGVQNPFYLRKAKKAQPTLYDGDKLLKTHHVPVIYVFYTATDFVMNASRFHELSTAYNVAMNRVVDLEAENSKLLEKIQNDDHNTMVKDFSKLEIAHLNLQLKYQHLKENLKNFKSKSSKDVPEFDAFFKLGKPDDQIQGHKNTIHSQNLQLKETVTSLQERLENFKAENEKVKHHYQELFNSIKIMRVKTIEKTTSLQTEIKNLKTQLKGKLPCVTSNVATPKVFVFEKHAIDVDPLPQPLRNNRSVHNGYLHRLKDTLDTLRETVKEARTNNKRDKFIATTPFTRKKHVTFADPLETPGNNATNHVKHPPVQKTNISIIHSTGVSNATKARRSQSKSNKMNDKTLPANSVPEKKVKDHHRKNKSKLSKKNRVDSSTSVRRTVFNTNSNSLCKTCNECIISFNHDKCVENSLKSSKPPPVKKIWRVKQVKQTRKPTGKVFTTVGYHWKPTSRIFPLGA
ncbi:hypothetical protein Tco_0468877 [Tanacetum coccineum]